MIKIENIAKHFEEITALEQVSLRIKEGTVFGLLGTNGAGKSTLLRMIAGVLKADAGEILIDGKPVWDNLEVKGQIFYISDDQFYFPNSNAEELVKYYKQCYTEFDEEQFYEYVSRFGLDPKRKIKTFSKGMKKQISILIGVCAKVKYLLCDETFDGLDPVMRQGIKSIFVQEMEEREFTPVIASHNLRELEDICDHIGVLHKGGVLFAKDLIDLKEDYLKVQCVIPETCEGELEKALKIVKKNRHGKLLTITVRGGRDKVLPLIEGMQPVYLETLPLTLEEIFISEMEGVGYDSKNLIF